MRNRSLRSSLLAGACGWLLCLPPAFAHPGHGDPPAEVESARASITAKEDYRYIDSNGLPDHPTGPFPNRHNPNTIRPQEYHFRVPLHPAANEKATPVEQGLFGVALNGVVFDPGTAEFWHRNPRSGWRYEAMSGKIDLGLDQNHAHVQPNGAYHYHGLPTGLINQLGGVRQMLLLGYAADGFPIYGPSAYADPDDAKSDLKELHSSYRLKSGTRPNGPGGQYDGTFVQDYEYVKGSGDLDECNGRTGVTPEYPEGVYYYVLTSDFPFVPRQWRGTPDSSFMRHRPPMPPHRGDRPEGPPPPPPDR